MTRMVHFVLVDDDDYDVMAVQRAFQELRVLNPIHVARDGVEALELLERTGEDALPRPLVMLLDLNMPRMNGLELLKEVRSKEELRETTVFVLTTSDGDRDRKAAAGYNVAGYVVKSDNSATDIMEVLTNLRQYWRVVEAL